MNKKIIMLSALSIPIIYNLCNYNINVNALNDELTNTMQTKATISINNYRVENVTDEGFDFIIKFNTTDDLTGVSLPYWKYGNYNGRKTNNSAVKIGTNEFKAHFKMSDMGSGTEYVNLGIHPTTSAGSFFIADINVKLDTTNPNLTLSLSNTNWTNKDISLNSVSNDNQNIIENLSFYDKNNNQTKTALYSSPKILFIKHTSGSVMTNYLSSKPNVTTVTTESITSVSQLRGYDIVIFDGHAWSVYNNIDTYLNQAFQEGISIITNMNDDVGGLAIVSGGYGNLSSSYTLKSYTNGYSGGGGGRVNRFAYLMDNKSESDNHHYMKPRAGAFIIANSTYADGNISPGVAMMTHSNGNKWIHFQTAGLSSSTGSIYRAIDEIMCGTMKSRQTYNNSFNISENGTYSVEVEDFSGNKTKKSINVTNIDKTLPTLNITGNPTSWTKSATLNVVGSDDLSGVKEIVLPNGTIVTSSTTNYTVTANGNYTFKIRDKAGNETSHTVSITMIDNTISDINKIKVTMEQVNESISNRKITMTFSPVIDSQSGIKGYSYAIDKSPTTIPDNTVDTTSNTIEKDITDSGVYYLHIKAIDNAGNVSGVVHRKIDIANLTSTVKTSDDYIKLDWTMNDLRNQTFKVYQRKAGSSEFQSISATNFGSSKQVKVLNIYPYTSGIENITFKTWDGETCTLPKSASLKQWMEEPNSQNPKGYGKGLIEVTPVLLSDFNNNPNNYLKDSSGEYKYDVIMFGTWDSNAGNDMSSSALNTVNEFIDSGRGVLLGHDTMRGWITQFAKLKDYLNLDLEMAYEGLNYSGTTVSINKKGLLTNYPWEIGDIGTNLTIPSTHTVNQMAKGDIWLRFGASPVISDRNFYLTSWNNTAFIQTGHSSGQATPDEQKILANTLFYLNQLSSDNFLDDNSGQDVSAPTKPTLNSFNINTSGVATFNINPSTDNGSTYEYYVESQSKDNDNLLLSNTTKSTITSGLKGYSYIIDTKSTTEPNNTVNTTSTTINSNITSNNMYLHIKAIDNVGNTSETLHYQLSDTTKPTMTITGNPTTWTNQNVTLNVIGSDVGTGVKHIVLPNGNIVNSSSTSYTVSANGNYTFKIVDKMGNETSQVVSVTKIDKTINNIVSVNENMTMVNTTNSTRKMTFTYNPIVDSQSGLKGYSYVIDKLPSTVPDNIVDTTSTTITKDITDTGVYYLHIKAIDNVGNVSSVIHKKVDVPVLTTKVNTYENKIKLDWTMNDLKNKTFKVYQKKPGNDTFQSISSTNFDKNKQVKVLNIYPGNGEIVNFTTWDGEQISIAKSGNLKQWMEMPNAENPKGYGQGIIEVNSVTQSEFNLNPQKYLKNSDGTWKYDVIYQGHWDVNNSQVPNDEALDLFREFINDGRGFLAGHDTIAWELGINKGLSKIRDLFNIKVGYWQNSSIATDEGHHYGGGFGSNSITINKTGLLTNYPWNIGTIGTKLSTPQSHSTGNFAYGDIWMTYPENSKYSWSSIPSTLDKYSNFYLTTWNNTAMIQTGHSNGSATPDEQKLLANTLFYLNQLSTDNFLDDNSGQDVTAPNKPTITGHTFTEDGFINLNFNSVSDNGSTYSYYVESQTKDNDSLTLSNVQTETITSGMNGYSYVVDSSPTTIPDNIIEQSTNQTIKIKTNNNGELYVHIRAIDNVGNGSETYHYKISDTTKPTLSLSLSPSTWTNGNVTINVTANDSGSGLKYITLPNGNIIKANTTSYLVDKNGIYSFKAIDYMGNEIVSSITVTNIDKNKPVVTITNNQNWTNQNVQVNISSKDE